MKQLNEYFKNHKINSVLDVGTGTGDFLVVLDNAFPTAKITGVDPNTESLKEANSKYPEVEFKEMGAEKLNFPENTFDVASISMALHHLPDIPAAFLEMKRVVKPGGFIIVSELFSDNLNEAQEIHKMYHHFRSATDRLLGISHNETFTKAEIIQLVESSGIDIQLQFEFKKGENLITSKEDIDYRVSKMEAMLERVIDFPEYETLKPKIEEFRKNVSEFGFEPATRLVLVGKI